MKFTKEQLRVLEKMVFTHINWKEGGCFGDGDEIVDKKEFAMAKSIFNKIREERLNKND